LVRIKKRRGIRLKNVIHGRGGHRSFHTWVLVKIRGQPIKGGLVKRGYLM